MILDFYNKLSETQEGIFLLTCGSILFLYIFGWFKPFLDLVVIAGALTMIYYGLDKLGAIAYLQNQLAKK